MNLTMHDRGQLLTLKPHVGQVERERTSLPMMKIPNKTREIAKLETAWKEPGKLGLRYDKSVLRANLDVEGLGHIIKKHLDDVLSDGP